MNTKNMRVVVSKISRLKDDEKAIIYLECGTPKDLKIFRNTLVKLCGTKGILITNMKTKIKIVKKDSEVRGKT